MNASARTISALPHIRPYILWMVAWVLAMIAVPIARWTWGDSIIPTAATLTSTLQFAAVFAILTHVWGVKRTLLVFVITAILTWAAEALGSKTGIPFGQYHYTDLLQPQIVGVPLLIPLAWFMMLGPAWAIAKAILGNSQRQITFAAISALAITAWDLFLDPQMVGWGFWAWSDPAAQSGYFGIPWINYFGWLLTAFIVTLVVRPARWPLPVIPLLAIYGIVWVLQSIGLAVFWGQPGPALWGSLAMGALLLLALIRGRRSNFSSSEAVL